MRKYLIIAFASAALFAATTASADCHVYGPCPAPTLQQACAEHLAPQIVCYFAGYSRN